MTGMMTKTLFALLPASLLVSGAEAQTSYDLRSPNTKIEVRIRTANGIRYDVLLGGRAILQDCSLSLDVDHKKLGVPAKVLKHKETSHAEALEPVFRHKSPKIHHTPKHPHLHSTAAPP